MQYIWDKSKLIEPCKHSCSSVNHNIIKMSKSVNLEIHYL